MSILSLRSLLSAAISFQMAYFHKIELSIYLTRFRNFHFPIPRSLPTHKLTIVVNSKELLISTRELFIALDVVNFWIKFIRNEE